MTFEVMEFSEYKKLDVQGKLRFWINMPQGSMLPSDWPNINEWHHHIVDVCAEALQEIQFLRSVAGAVSRGPSHADFKRQSRMQGD